MLTRSVSVLHHSGVVFEMDNEFKELTNDKEKKEENNDKIDVGEKEKEAEEGGWGYAVCFGMVISFIVGVGNINSFGLIYKDFMNDTHSSAKSLTTAHGTFAMMLAVGGIILNVMSKSKLSIKLGGFLGASIFCLGSFLTILITSIGQLSFTFGVLQGIGFGIVVPAFYSTINYYFVKKRTTVMSACKAIQGLVLIWYPQLIKKIIVHYGFRGTLLLISGISLHIIPGVAVVNSHNRRQRNRLANDLESRRKADDNVDLLNHNENCDKSKIKFKELKQARYVLEEILCLKILKDPKYINICFGQSCVNYSDIAFFMLQPMLLYQYGYDMAEVATCISIGAGADVAGRFMLAIISSTKSFNTRSIFYIATVFTLIMRIVMLQVRQFLWMSTVTAILGVLRAWLHVASPLVISNHVTHQDFPGAYALFLVIGGLVNMFLSPLIGQMKDMYEDYVPAFYGLAACCLPCLIFWPIEYLWKK